MKFKYYELMEEAAVDGADGGAGQSVPDTSEKEGSTSASMLGEAANQSNNEGASNGENTNKEAEEKTNENAIGDDYSLDGVLTGDYDKEFAEEYIELAKELGLSKTQADGIAGKMYARMQKHYENETARVSEMWSKETLEDPEFQGDARAQKVSGAVKAVDKFGSPELKKILFESPIGNNKHVINFLYNVSKAMPVQVDSKESQKEWKPEDFYSKTKF